MVPTSTWKVCEISTSRRQGMGRGKRLTRSIWRTSEAVPLTFVTIPEPERILVSSGSLNSNFWILSGDRNIDSRQHSDTLSLIVTFKCFRCAALDSYWVTPERNLCNLLSAYIYNIIPYLHNAHEHFSVLSQWFIRLVKAMATELSNRHCRVLCSEEYIEWSS